MISNRKLTSKGDVHIDILKRAEKLSKPGSKVFDKNSLKANEEDIRKESKLLGLSHNDIQEIETASRAASTGETASEGANLSDQIKASKLTLEDYVLQQKQFIQFIESYRKELMKLIYRDRKELDPFGDWVGEMEEAHYVLSNIAATMPTVSKLVNKTISVSAKLKVSKKQHRITKDI